MSFLIRLYCRYGPFRFITSDRGGEFWGKVIKKCTSLLGHKAIYSSAYHPQGNGKAEAAVKNVKSTLVKQLTYGTAGNDNTWDEIPLQMALYTTRSRYCVLIGCKHSFLIPFIFLVKVLLSMHFFVFLRL